MEGKGMVMPDPLSLISVCKCVYFWSPPSCGQSRVPGLDVCLFVCVCVCVCVCARGVMEAEGPVAGRKWPGPFHLTPLRLQTNYLGPPRTPIIHSR